jgi:hypothetical protein
MSWTKKWMRRGSARIGRACAPGLGEVWGVGAHDVWIAAACGVLNRTQ